MAKPPSEPPSRSGPELPTRHADRARVAREARQAAALRANLHRRKAQVRGREAVAADLGGERPEDMGPEDQGFEDAGHSEDAGRKDAGLG